MVMRVIEDMKTELLLTVTERRDVADGIVELALRAPTGGRLPSWTPGAHIDLVLGDQLTRQYSLCGDPSDEWTWRIAVLREAEGRGGSKYVHEHLTVGSTVASLGPRNHFELRSGSDFIFIAGGIGITPILPMIAATEKSGHTWELHYGGRCSESMAFVDRVQQLGSGNVTVYTESENGRIDLDSALGTVRPGTQIYCCGPSPLLDAVQQRAVEWPAGSLVVERFAADPSNAAGADGPGFEVVFEQSGTTAVVPPGRSIVEVAEEHGISVITSCEEGVCGTCETTVLEGEVDHRDSVLSAEERGSGSSMLICVSRCNSGRLVLDL